MKFVAVSIYILWSYNLHIIIFAFTIVGLLLRPFPEDAHFYGKFQLCRNNPCSRPQCTYAHNDLELTEWNREKQARSNRKQQKKLLFIYY